MSLVIFETNLKIDGKVFYFTFYGVTTSFGRRFLIACYGSDVHTVFHMIQNDKGAWCVMTDAPVWIIKVEDHLSDIIETGLESEGS